MITPRRRFLLRIIGFIVIVILFNHKISGLRLDTCLRKDIITTFIQSHEHSFGSPSTTGTTTLANNSRLTLTETHRWQGSRSFVSAGSSLQSTEETDNRLSLRQIRQFCSATFLPNSDVIPEYYRFVRLRTIQRLISSTNNILGTQALLYSLGIKSRHLGVAAATSWVLKDTLGKLTRVFWAGKFGRKFDSDAKKWRFRSALFFAAGNALEIVTYLFPTLFLVSAASGNALKQIALLTASATRNTIYKSFSRTADNIGELTAKGEAQIAVVDLVGMCIGVGLAKAINARVGPILLAFVILSVFDLILVYKEIQSVVFYTLNFERLKIVLDEVFSMLDNRVTDAENQRGFDDNMVDNNNTMDPLVNETLEQISLFPTRQAAGKADWLSVIFFKNKDISEGPQFSSELNKLDHSRASVGNNNVRAIHNSTIAESISLRENIDSPKIYNLHPRRVANIENLLKPATPGNGLLRGWSTLSPEGLNTFHRYLQSGSLDNDDMFVVLCHVRCLRNWFEAWQIKAGLRTNEILRIHNGRLPVIVNTEILLKPEATAADFFRATIIVNRILYQFKQRTEDVDIDRAAGLLQTLPVSSQDRSLEVDKGGFDTVFVDKLRLSATKFEKANARDIRHTLSEAEWDLRSFSFGSLDVRVKWHAENFQH